jgi:hypothetical protein
MSPSCRPKARPSGASDSRGRCNLVVMFVGSPTGDDTRSFLGRVAEYDAAFREWTAEVLAAVQGTPRAAIHIKRCGRLPFSVLADADGQVHRAVGAVTPVGEPAAAGYITDRWVEMYAACRTTADQRARRALRPPRSTGRLYMTASILCAMARPLMAVCSSLHLGVVSDGLGWSSSGCPLPLAMPPKFLNNQIHM